MCAQITAVDSYRADRDAFTLQALCKTHQLPDRDIGVIGIDQQRRACRVGAGKVLERVLLAIMGLDVGMGHRAEQRNVPAHARKHRCRASEAREVAGAGRQEAGLGPVRASQSEVDQAPSFGSEHATHCLGRNHGLELQQVDEARFDKLSFP